MGFFYKVEILSYDSGQLHQNSDITWQNGWWYIRYINEKNCIELFIWFETTEVQKEIMTEKNDFDRTSENIEKALEEWLKKPLIFNKPNSDEKM